LLEPACYIIFRISKIRGEEESKRTEAKIDALPEQERASS